MINKIKSFFFLFAIYKLLLFCCDITKVEKFMEHFFNNKSVSF